ncbi:hypothetical protein NQ314_002012 [Rhamnusium bicolor]|uniref:Uncharacterized protein n=1 Tax=Rhamnusium bicolor TaxID=1586634 RepID=A0AAV8ZSC9_9CUCU|nr:hypothetical protein NQ314_002012 [Rhamnusium bicolor]
MSVFRYKQTDESDHNYLFDLIFKMLEYEPSERITLKRSFTASILRENRDTSTVRRTRSRRYKKRKKFIPITMRAGSNIFPV